MVGITIPLLAMKHAYIVTEKIPGIEMTPNVRDHDASVYLKLQGDALSVGGYEHNPIIIDQVRTERHGCQLSCPTPLTDFFNRQETADRFFQQDFVSVGCCATS